MKQMAKDELLHHCTVFQIPKKLLNFSLIIMQVISVAFYNLHVLGPQYIYQNSKLLAPDVFFADPVKTSLLAAWAEQNAKYTWFLPQTS